MTTMKRRGGAFLMIAALALFLTGCMRMHVNVSINPNDTVDGEIIMAVSDEAVEGFGISPQDAWNDMAADADMPDEFDYSDYAEDGYTGGRYTFSEMPISEWSAGDTADDLMIVRDGDEFVVTGVLDLSDGDSEELPGMEEIFASMDVRMSFTFPGEITEASGDISGSTVTWTATYGERLVMSARGPASASAADVFPWLWVGLGVGVLAVAGVAAALLAKNRKKASTADLAAQTPYGQQWYGQAPQYDGQPQGEPQQFGQVPPQFAPPQQNAQASPPYGAPQQYGQAPEGQQPYHGESTEQQPEDPNQAQA